jgi:lipoprotein NlpD
MLTKFHPSSGFALLLAGGTWCALLVGGCASSSIAPIEQKSFSKPAPIAKVATPRKPPQVSAAPPAVYRVAAGDTLYSIAWRYGLDARDIGRWNQLDNFNRILVGQSLVLRERSASESPAGLAVAPATLGKPVPLSATPSALPRPIDANTEVARVAVTPSAAAITPAGTTGTTEVADAAEAEDDAASEEAPEVPGGARTSGGIAWRWPATGTAKPTVAATGAVGLDITGKRGQPVSAAADGQVVYSGNGLRGYGQLIIIKHNEVFLSAYAHNDKLLVVEGAKVKAGQQIGAMGDSEADIVALHFEIRRGGKAVEPRQFLPAR